MAEQWSTGDSPPDPGPESAVLMAARQLSEEAALHPRVAGLTGLRRRDAESRSRGVARRVTELPAA